MGRWGRWLLGLGLTAAAIAVFWWFVLRPDPVPVTVVRLARGTVEETVSNSKAGTVTARRRAKISPEIGGRVAFIGFRPGASVRRGDVLMRLNDSDLRAALALARQQQATASASAREACLQADLAERDLQRSRDLEQERIVSAEALDRLESQRDAAVARCQAQRAATESARAQIDLAGAGLAKATLRAPFDGVVADLDAEVGEYVTPSPPGVPIPAVLDLIDPTSIYVSAPLDEVDAGRIAPGLPARVTLDPYPGRSFDGTVTRVAPYVQDIEEQNRTLEVEVDFKDQVFARTLFPGTSADVEVILARASDVLRVPAYALLEGDLLLVYDDGRLASRPVQVGLRNWEYAEIKGGVEAGTPVVVSLDRSEVKEGARAVVAGEHQEKGAPGSGEASGRPAR